MTLEFEQLSEDTRRTDLVRYTIAIAAILLAALAWWGARLVLTTEAVAVITVALLTAAVLVSAWIAGTGPGIVAAAVGMIALLFLASGSTNPLGPSARPDLAVIAAATALSALVIVVIGRLHTSHSALMRGLPEIERRARDRANDAALRRVEEERRIAAAAKEEVADIYRTLQQWKSTASTASTARTEYLDAVRLAVALPLRAIEQYAAGLRATAGELTELQRRDVDGIAMCEEHIVTLLDSVLAPGRVESGQLLSTTANVSLAEVVSRGVALVEPLLATFGSSVECGNLEAPAVRADAAILTQVLARLVVENVVASGPGTLRLEVNEVSDGGVTLACRRVREGQTLEPDGKPFIDGRQDVSETVWSPLAAAEQVSRMGGTVTLGRVPAAEPSFAIRLSTRAATEARVALPAVLWPPVAFEFPRSSPS